MVFSKFDSLSVRPPTPPRDLPVASPYVIPDAGVDETFQFLEDPFGEKPVPPAVTAARVLPNTPAQSPSSDISIPSSTGSRQKRVNFDAQTCTIPTRKYATPSWTPTRSSPLRALPQTRIEKPLKSCLKLSGALPTSPSVDQRAAHTFKTFAEMLESTVKLLASSDRASRLDAYHALQKTLQAYDKTPDDQAIRQKMSLLTQFIRRDMQATSLIGTGLDSQLVTQALKLLMALFRIPDLIHTMDEDFCAFVIERGITVAGDASIPKVVVNTHLAVLMQQSFRPKIMTAARAEKVLDVLETVPDRVSGCSVQAYRIRIYKRLIQQRSDVMIKNTERWFKHTLKALIASQHDINQSALDTCVTAAKQLGHDRHVTKSVVTMLNRVRSDGKTFAKLLTTELERMLNGDDAHLVPQIWGAITSLLRDSLQSHIFSTMREWLQLFEKCLVSNQETVRLNTNVAFCILVYAVNISPATPDSWMNMLLNIPLSQLRQRFNIKKIELDAATSSYLTLLYYAFPPNASYEQLDRCWIAFVAEFWSPVVHQQSNAQINAGCQTVTALLNGSRKPWIEHRALDLRPQCMIQRIELPLLDPKWVRKSLSLVLQLVETLLDATTWSKSEQQTNQPAKVMWSAVLDSLIEASSKEVMTSSDTKDAMAIIVNLLRRIFDKHATELALSQQKEDIWADKFCFLIEVVIQKLGAAQFVDKCLTRIHDNNFEVASTPSHRSKQQNDRISPLLYFVDLLVNRSEGKLGDTVRLRALQLIIEPAFGCQSTRSGRLEFFRDCLAVVSGSPETTVSSKFSKQIASLLQTTLDQRKLASNDQSQRSLGKEYSIIVDILGLGCSYFLRHVGGQDVLSTFINTVRTEAGEGAVILAVIENVSQRVLNKTADEDKFFSLPYVSILLQNLPKQMTRRALEQGRQALWPSSPSSGRTTDFDSYKHFYDAIISASLAGYKIVGIGEIEKIREFITALTSSIQQCAMSHLAVYLRKIQEAVAVWIEDPRGKMHSKEKALKAMHREVIALWTQVCRAIERLPRKDGQVLLHLESLMVAGLSSRRRSIVNKSIEMWNNTFGKEENLRYPSRLEQRLRQMGSTVDLSLPSLEVREGDVCDIAFYDSESSLGDEQSTVPTLRAKASPLNVTKAARRSASQSPAVAASKRRRAPAQQTSKARLRHSDSQIQFEPIASSPSSPLVQEAPILTDRQREMLERQKTTNRLFVDMRAASPQQRDARSLMEIHSDALTADDLPENESTMTPAKTLAAMSTMNEFLGSSPTPCARRNTKKFVNKNADVATPNVARTIRLAENDELTSSPPQMPKSVDRRVPASNSNVQVDSSYEDRQPESTVLISFEEGTTVEDDALPDIEVADDNDERLKKDPPKDLSLSVVSSSVVDIQITAQMDADIQAHINASRSSSDDESVSGLHLPHLDVSPQNNIFYNAEVQDSQVPSLIKASSDVDVEDTSSTSRVGDSFTRTSSANTTPKRHNLRRSSRHSATSSPTQSSTRKRRKSDAPKNGISKQTKEAVVEEKQTPISKSIRSKQQDNNVLDGNILAVPKTQKSSRKRKSADFQLLTTGATEPESNHRRSMRRTQSLLSQVENSQDLHPEDAPTPKRLRQSFNADVSEAKSAPAAVQEQSSSQSKRLSHVRVSPRKSSELEAFISIPATASATPSPTKNHVDPPSSHKQASQQSAAGSSTPSRSFAERVILTPRSIIAKLRSIKDYLLSTPQLVIGREEGREISSALFDIGRRVHEAGVREEGEGSKAD